MAQMSWTSVSAGNIFSETAALIRRNLMICAVGAFLLFAAHAGSDLSIRRLLPVGSRSAPLFGLIYLPVLALIHYLVVTRLMNAEHLTVRGWSLAGLLNYLIANLLVSIGMIFGLVLLIVPGFIVMLRWTIYGNFIIAQGLGPVAAIKASWKATSGRAGTIFILMLILGLAAIPGIILARGGLGLTVAVSTTTVITGDVYTAVLGMISLCVTTSIYAMLVGPDHTQLIEVFA